MSTEKPTDAQRREANATTILDILLCEAAYSCTSCGASRWRVDLTATRVWLDRAECWVLMALCPRCDRRGAEAYQAIIEKLEDRYGHTDTDAE